MPHFLDSIGTCRGLLKTGSACDFVRCGRERDGFWVLRRESARRIRAVRS
jgi:hypothetical protein